MASLGNSFIFIILKIFNIDLIAILISPRILNLCRNLFNKIPDANRKNTIILWFLNYK